MKDQSYVVHLERTRDTADTAATPVAATSPTPLPHKEDGEVSGDEPQLVVAVHAGTIEMMQYAPDGGVVACDRVVLPKGSVAGDGTVHNAVCVPLLADLLKRVCGSGWGVENPLSVGVSLPEQHTIVHTCEVQHAPGDEASIADALILIVQEAVTIPLADLYWEYRIIETSANGSIVLFTAARKKYVDACVAWFTAAGMTIRFLEPKALAQARAVLTQEMQRFPVLLIDVGPSVSSVGVFRPGGVLHATQFIHMGSDALAACVQDCATRGMSCADVVTGGNEEVLAEIERHFEDPLHDLMHACHFYKNIFGQPIGKVLLSGDAKVAPKLDSFLAHKLEIPTSFVDPLHHIPSDSRGSIPNPLQYTTVLGLALRAVYEEGVDVINFIRIAQEKKQHKNHTVWAPWRWLHKKK